VASALNVAQFLLCKFVFLRDGGKYLDLTNRCFTFYSLTTHTHILKFAIFVFHFSSSKTSCFIALERIRSVVANSLDFAMFTPGLEVRRYMRRPGTSLVGLKSCRHLFLADCHTVSWLSGKSLNLLRPAAFPRRKMCQKCVCGRGSAPDPAGVAYSTPQVP